MWSPPLLQAFLMQRGTSPCWSRERRDSIAPSQPSTRPQDHQGPGRNTAFLPRSTGGLCPARTALSGIFSSHLPPWPLPEGSQPSPHPNHWLHGSDRGPWTPVPCRRPDSPDGSWASRTGADWGAQQDRTLPVYRMRLIIPGITIVNMDSSFMYPQRIQPPFTWYMFCPARHLWTKICQGNANGEGTQSPGLGREEDGDPHPASPGHPRQRRRVTGSTVCSVCSCRRGQGWRV